MPFEVLAADGAGEADVEEDEGNGPQGDDQIFGPRTLVRQKRDPPRRDVLTKPQLKIFLEGEAEAVVLRDKLPAGEVPAFALAALVPSGGRAGVGRLVRL